jgi:hypothetical protein
MSRRLKTRSTWLAICCPLILFLRIQPAFTGPLDFNLEDIVTVTAERAWETDEADVIEFSGSFELRAPDWTLTGDTAVVYGKLDDPGGEGGVNIQYSSKDN